MDYAQALLLTCHASMEPEIIERTQTFLTQALERAPNGHPFVKNQLLKMKRVLEQLLSKPQYVWLHDVLVEWKAKEQSVMATWENFPAGSNYLEDQGLLRNSKHGRVQVLSSGREPSDRSSKASPSPR